MLQRERPSSFIVYLSMLAEREVHGAGRAVRHDLGPGRAAGERGGAAEQGDRVLARGAGAVEAAKTEENKELVMSYLYKNNFLVLLLDGVIVLSVCGPHRKLPQTLLHE